MFAEGVGSGLWPTTEILCVAAITPPLRGDSRPRLSHLGGDRPPPTTRARVSVGPPDGKRHDKLDGSHGLRPRGSDRQCYTAATTIPTNCRNGRRRFMACPSRQKKTIPVPRRLKGSRW